ncbi:MAG: 16S rRNA (uracil(1498)-N(3))-methyltransferase [Pseudomonadota bacterium]
MRRFFIEPSAAAGDTAVLSGTDSKHISSVLRLKSGTGIVLFDGTGAEYEAEIVSVSSDRVSVSGLKRIVSNSESPVSITVAQGFLKEKKMDDLIRALTELGINRWMPFFAERSVPHPSGLRLSTRTDRWRTIAREALKQCRRSRLPEILAAGSLNDVIALSAESELKIAFWEKAVESIPAALNAKTGEDHRRIFILLGPEGGLTDTEIQSVTTAGFKAVTLGPRILRAETATVVACSLMQYLLGDLGRNRDTITARP